MFDPSSFVNPTPLAHADTSRDVLPRGGISQWRPTRFNLYDPEMRIARGSSPGESHRLVPNIRISVSAKYRHGLRAAKTEPGADGFCLRFIKNTKKLELVMSEKALVDHIFVRLEPQVQDYVEVRNPQNTVQLLEVLAKFEERYSCKAIRGSRNSDNVEGRGWNERRMSNFGNRGNWRNSEVIA
ncbi:uncharacterized protein TNCV_847271 [Trichonephila clavipes]|nr:uncharacterized protein TNCV_847271 [Trichonephila clavipes]